MENEKKTQIINFNHNDNSAFVIDKVTKNLIAQTSKLDIIDQMNVGAETNQILSIRKPFKNDNYYTFVVTGNEVIYYININENDKKYINELHNLYLQIKLKNQKIKKLKVLKTRITSTLLVAAAIATYGTILHNHDDKLRQVMDEQNKIMSDSTNIDPKTAYHQAIDTLRTNEEKTESSTPKEYINGTDQTVEEYYEEKLLNNPYDPQVRKAYEAYQEYLYGNDDKEENSKTK